MLLVGAPEPRAAPSDERPRWGYGGFPRHLKQIPISGVQGCNPWFIIFPWSFTDSRNPNAHVLETKKDIPYLFGPYIICCHFLIQFRFDVPEMFTCLVGSVLLKDWNPYVSLMGKED